MKKDEFNITIDTNGNTLSFKEIRNALVMKNLGPDDVCFKFDSYGCEIDKESKDVFNLIVNEEINVPIHQFQKIGFKSSGVSEIKVKAFRSTNKESL